jgi:hypothetical protein
MVNYLYFKYILITKDLWFYSILYGSVGGSPDPKLSLFEIP